MRAVVQVADGAAVSVDGQMCGEFSGAGLVILLGITHSDTESEAVKLADKIWQLRIMDQERSAAQNDSPILVISQFTLYADTRKGRRPSWNQASAPEHSKPLVESFVNALRALGANVSTGVFGAHMRVSFTNDGPVTLIVEANNPAPAQ